MNERSVRLRLLRSEVERFRRTGEVSAEIRFSEGGSFSYRLRRGDAVQATVRFADDTLEVLVPAAEADPWCDGPQVGIYSTSGPVEILVEKDFRRTSAPSPDDDDRYPNPRAARRLSEARA